MGSMSVSLKVNEEKFEIKLEILEQCYIACCSRNCKLLLMLNLFKHFVNLRNLTFQKYKYLVSGFRNMIN